MLESNRGNIKRLTAERSFQTFKSSSERDFVALHCWQHGMMSINVVCVCFIQTKSYRHLRCSHFGVTNISFLCTSLHNSSPAAPAGGGKRVDPERAGGCCREGPVGEQ